MAARCSKARSAKSHPRTCLRALRIFNGALKRYLTGWRGYFGFCETPSVLQRLDEWVRRRTRCFFWKQWRRGSTRLRELLARGVDRNLAVQTAGSPHNAWRLSNSPALQRALTNRLLRSLGLPTLNI
ncbi:group II intron maturase-specific domain-containing protein [Paraburkholderia sp. RAU2J]|uniref:group II intron maturase-specific domain-containing protein n=1 Tax=Paraburkholderia sp. RAU2J TaxID=1938810 RepID=UPI001F545BBF|nr:group II intron maturase-specific domain-containing protein [Paraburkholderia sp. RAU2J]